MPFMVLVHCVTRDWASLFSEHLSTLCTLYRSAVEIIAVSQDNLALLRECFGLPAKMGLVIHNGVAPRFFQDRNEAVRARLRQEMNIPNDAVACLTVARMELVKGYQFLLKAASELQRRPVGSRLHYVWIGSGSMEPRIRAMVSRMGLRNITLVSSTSKVEQYLDACDVFVLPSLFEGMPVSIMEAMAKGLAVVATSVSGTTEELGPTGVLLPDPNIAPEATIAGLIDALEFLALDQATRETLGNGCRRRAEQLFTQNRMITDYLDLVQQRQLTCDIRQHKPGQSCHAR
jgi:glycosyltransferase involved in cell wall biosynthesis